VEAAGRAVTENPISFGTKNFFYSSLHGQVLLQILSTARIRLILYSNAIIQSSLQVLVSATL
jgi:hypothetical protein